MTVDDFRLTLLAVCVALAAIFFGWGQRRRRQKECSSHPVPGRPCQPHGPHAIARGADPNKCQWCGEPSRRPQQ
jgi:hypothetical protein